MLANGRVLWQHRNKTSTRRVIGFLTMGATPTDEDFRRWGLRPEAILYGRWLRTTYLRTGRPERVYLISGTIYPQD